MKHLVTLTFLACTFFACPGTWAQEAPKLNARELFYAPPPAPQANPVSKNSAPTSASSAVPANPGKKQTTAKNNSSGTRPPATAGNAPVNAPVNNAGTSAPETTVAQVGQQTTGQAHVIAASATTGPLGLRYAVLKRQPNGSYREVDPDTSFRTGDAIRLQVEANTAGYLYVVTQGTSHQWQLLFPRPEVSGGSNRVEPHVKVEVPGDRGVWKFDEHAGTEKLFVVLARQPEPDLDKLIYSIGGAGGGAATGARESLMAQAAIRDDVVSHLRDQMLSRDLVFEKVDQDTSDAAPVKNENAAYVVNVSTAPDARVVKDFALQHQ